MTALILDTSRKEGFVILTKDGELDALVSVPSKEFLPVAAALSKRDNITLEFIAVGIGPGSYTGTRSGAAFAKSLAFALNIPVIGFYSPLAYLPAGEGNFAYLIPGKRNDTSVLTGTKSEEGILSLSEPTLIPNEELVAFLASYPLQATAEETLLNFAPLLPYLQERFAKQEYDFKGEVDIAYLYDIPTAGQRAGE